MAMISPWRALQHTENCPHHSVQRAQESSQSTHARAPSAVSRRVSECVSERVASTLSNGKLNVRRYMVQKGKPRTEVTVHAGLQELGFQPKQHRDSGSRVDRASHWCSGNRTLLVPMCWCSRHPWIYSFYFFFFPPYSFSSLIVSVSS